MVVSRPNPWTPTKQMDSKFDSGYFQGATCIYDSAVISEI